jgi:hypothetical protein
MTAGRLFIRYMSTDHFLSADWINAVACVFLVGFTATYAHYIDLAFAVGHAYGKGPPVSDDNLASYFKGAVVVEALFWITIFLVKASFLMLYSSPFKLSRRFMEAWWGAVMLTVLCFLSSMASVLPERGPNPA